MTLSDWLKEREKDSDGSTDKPWEMFKDPARPYDQMLITGFDENIQLNFEENKSLEPIKSSRQILAKVNYQFCDAKFIVNSRNNYDTLVAVAQRLLDTLYAVENYLACNNDWSGKARHKQVNKAIADCEKLIKGEK